MENACFQSRILFCQKAKLSITKKHLELTMGMIYLLIEIMTCGAPPFHRREGQIRSDGRRYDWTQGTKKFPELSRVLKGKPSDLTQKNSCQHKSLWKQTCSSSYPHVQNNGAGRVSPAHDATGSCDERIANAQGVVVFLLSGINSGTSVISCFMWSRSSDGIQMF